MHFILDDVLIESTDYGFWKYVKSSSISDFSVTDIDSIKDKYENLGFLTVTN